jgi:gluconokinase
MRDPLVLGVDLGTGSARAFLFDAAGERRGGVRLPYDWRVGVDGSVEADADELVRLVLAAIGGALEQLPRGARVAGVGFSALWHTILGVDEAGRGVTPALAWNDTRATDVARGLRERMDARAYHQRTGAVLHPGYPPARILWLRQHHDAARDVRRWLSVPEYLWLKLTGKYEADVSIAAGSGLLDRSSLCWADDALDAIGIDASQLSAVVTGAEAIRRSRDVAASEPWPLLRDAMWRAPVGDGACANIGSGCTDNSSMALSIGTSAALRVLTGRSSEALPDGLWSYPLDRDAALLGAAISNGGLVRDWLSDTLRVSDDDAALDALLLARPPASHGLVVLPHLAGERSPDWPLDVSGSIHGLSAASSPLDILQAGMEAVAYRLHGLRARLRAAVPQAETIVASGGALQRSAYWPQLIADVFGETIHVCTDAETSSRGAALLALLAAGEIESLADVRGPGTAVIDPDVAAHELHARAIIQHESDGRLSGA